MLPEAFQPNSTKNTAEADKAHSLNPLPKADVTSVASTVLFGESIHFTSGRSAYVLTHAE